ncbi:glucan 1,3-beta-glucosidase precursor [Mytilinidion resinicola]|uniref:glucan 1,3-beta-glucosidase n=1 Tax=Mytilinidion resinicola TaxID=574789 RepID=A0A6A6YXM9_9PEZI|nr:glucan 1,3-beta-glucosidase precursor [Mytilinidion resinicola]KAF2812665.1 glucan 1,3-beta-glucosidase precursor [Mytilinidion resinicola]
MLLQNYFAVVAAIATTCAAEHVHHRDLKSRAVAFDWGTTKIRGVNIGGWLVTEPFITPSIYLANSKTDEVHDEWTLCAKLGAAGCQKVLKPHWDSWVSLSDFQKIKKAGFNIVRIPIGYWAYKNYGGPYTSGTAAYLDKAIGWARTTGLKVLIDLHGAPKSQNGFDNSGHRFDAGNPTWGTGDSIAQTHAVLAVIENKYAKAAYQDVVVGIELVNEPLMPVIDTNGAITKKFYRDGYNNLRKISDTPVILHDGFFGPAYWNGFLTPSDNNAQGVVIDHHEYQVFDKNLIKMTPAQHRQQVCDAASSYDGADKWTFVGEWSAALTDCAPSLNGFKRGNRYEGTWDGATRTGSCAGKTGKVSSWTQSQKDDVRKYIETQLDTFESKTKGWMFWNFKTEGGAGEWDLFQLLDGGLFPQPITNRKFGKFCK